MSEAGTELSVLLKDAEKHLAVMKGNGAGSPYHIVDTSSFNNHLKSPAGYEGHAASIGQADALCGNDPFGRMLPEGVTSRRRICGNCLRSLHAESDRDE